MKTKRVRPWQSEKKRGAFNAKPDPVYRTNRWTKASKGFRAAHPICAAEGCQALTTQGGGVTDHIVPIRLGGAIYDKRNWQPLCHSCHNKKSRAEQLSGIQVETQKNERGYLIPKCNTNNAVDA